LVAGASQPAVFIHSSCRREGGVDHKEESISYIQDFGFIAMEDFEPGAI